MTLGVAATASTASGAIVVFDINPDFQITYLSATYTSLSVDALNFNNATFGTAGQDSFSLMFGFYQGTYFYGNEVTARVPLTGTLLAAGATIGPSLVLPGSSPYISNDKNQLATGIHYLALTMANPFGEGQLYGWLEIVTTDSNDAGDVFNDNTFTRFAFNDIAGQSILAGQTTAVPEASTLGLVGGLFGLVAAAHVRRRKAKQAAASDKFLALAAGEKLN